MNEKELIFEMHRLRQQLSEAVWYLRQSKDRLTPQMREDVGEFLERYVNSIRS